MHRLLVSVAIGLLSTLPLFTVYVLVGLLPLPEWLAPSVATLCWLGVAIGSSVVSGHVYVRMLGWPVSLAEAFLANSSGWVCLTYVLIFANACGSRVLTEPHGGEVLLSALALSIVGLVVTWGVIKIGR